MLSVPVYKLLDELGGYLSPKSAIPNDITPLISALLKVNGAPLFDLYVDVDLYDRTKSSVYLDLPTKHQSHEFLTEDQVKIRWLDLEFITKKKELIKNFQCFF